MVNQTEFKELIRKYLDAKASKEEEARLFHYYELLQKDKHWDPKVLGEQKETLDALFTNIMSEIGSSERRHVLFRRWRIVAAAAAVLILVSVALWFGKLNTNDKQLAINDFGPGKNIAVLNMDDGQKIRLNDSTHVQSHQSGTLVTPKGGQYQLELPDGSKVWLNAASSLKFPSSFSGKERRVELIGEAYFEVAKLKGKPFKVIVNDTEIEVLGTHFNVMSYQDEKTIQTTLLEGSVKITKGKESKILVPGEQAIVREDIKIAQTNVEEAIAWRDGYFIFADEGIESIMRKLSRWYNVAIEYQGEVPNKSFNGKISRSENISTILEKLELTGSVKFKIEKEEGRIVVMK